MFNIKTMNQANPLSDVYLGKEGSGLAQVFPGGGEPEDALKLAYAAKLQKEKEKAEKAEKDKLEGDKYLIEATKDREMWDVDRIRGLGSYGNEYLIPTLSKIFNEKGYNINTIAEAQKEVNTWVNLTKQSKDHSDRAIVMLGKMESDKELNTPKNRKTIDLLRNPEKYYPQEYEAFKNYFTPEQVKHGFAQTALTTKLIADGKVDLMPKYNLMEETKKLAQSIKPSETDVKEGKKLGAFSTFFVSPVMPTKEEVKPFAELSYKNDIAAQEHFGSETMPDDYLDALYYQIEQERPTVQIKEPWTTYGKGAKAPSMADVTKISATRVSTSGGVPTGKTYKIETKNVEGYPEGDAKEYQNVIFNLTGKDLYSRASGKNIGVGEYDMKVSGSGYYPITKIEKKVTSPEGTEFIIKKGSIIPPNYFDKFNKSQIKYKYGLSGTIDLKQTDKPIPLNVTMSTDGTTVFDTEDYEEYTVKTKTEEGKEIKYVESPEGEQIPLLLKGNQYYISDEKLLKKGFKDVYHWLNDESKSKIKNRIKDFPDVKYEIDLYSTTPTNTSITKRIYKTSKSGKEIYSDDGGKTWLYK